MDSRLNSIKDRIRGLINRNKQIDTEIEDAPQESKKEALNTEKEQNNNELRKQRTKKYEIQQISEDAEYIKKCCLYLQKLGIVRSQHQFCTDFLNKSQHYLAMVICESRRPAIDAVHNLIKNLNELYALYETYDNKEAINRSLYHLIDKGQQIITRRILKYL